MNGAGRMRAVSLVAVLLVQLWASDAPRNGDSAAAQEPVWPGATWQLSTPAEQGLDGAPLVQLTVDIGSGRYGHVDRIVVVRHGFKVLDERYTNDYVTISAGRDLEPHQYNYNHPDWHPFYRGSELHTLQSVTKSVAAALVGIALDRGELAGTHVRVLPMFREHVPANLDDRKRAVKLVDLLTMRSGIEWHESDRPMGPTNTTIQLEASDDWIAFTLDQPMDAEPGERWVYNSGGSHLLSGMIRKATGLHAHEYAEEYLFGPIGIQEYHWKLTPMGFADAEGGLYLHAEDLARFGYLFLRDGVWDGEQVISRHWVRMSTTRIIDDVNPGSGRDNRGYGFQWWRLDRSDTEIWAGTGYGGQYLLVIPEHDIVGVVNSWNIYGGPRSVLASLIEALLTSVRV